MFIKEIDEDDPNNCIFIEANIEIYRAHNKQHSKNIRKKQRELKHNYRVVSFESSSNENDCHSLHETTADEGMSFEDYVLTNIQIEKLKLFNSSLGEDELKILNLVYYSNSKNHSLRKIARQNNIAHKTLDYRLKKILKKLKVFFAQNP